MPDFNYQGDITLAIDVSDVDASITWFKDILGFEVVFQVEGWVEVSTPVSGLTIGFGEGEVSAAPGTVPVFGVTDIDAARSELEAKGVAFDGDTFTVFDMVKLCNFSDPDGNRYMFAQSLNG